jgi:hypothetical protein
MITGYASYVAYLRKLAWQHKLLAGSFYVGDSWTILGAQRHRLHYPTLWLERPIIRPIYAPDGDSFKMRFDGAFSIVGNAAPDDYERQESVLATCQVIAQEIFNRIKSDSDENIFDLLVDNYRMESLAALMVDDVHGWRVEFAIELNTWTDCINADSWDFTAEAAPSEPNYLPEEAVVNEYIPLRADFAYIVSDDYLTLSDCSQYPYADPRDSVTYSISQGVLPEFRAFNFHEKIPLAVIDRFDFSQPITIVQEVRTRSGLIASHSVTFTISAHIGTIRTAQATALIEAAASATLRKVLPASATAAVTAAAEASPDILQALPNVAGLAAWLRADAGLPAGTLSTWTDQASGIIFTNDPGAATRVTDANSNPALRFTKAATARYTGAISLTSTPEIFVVVKIPTAGTNEEILGFGGARGIYLTSANQLAFQGITAAVSGAITRDTNSYMIINVTVASTSVIRRNSVQVASAVTGVGVGTVMRPGNRTGIGLDGNIAEIIVYTGTLSPSSRAEVHTYLSDKYNLTLS